MKKLKKLAALIICAGALCISANAADIGVTYNGNDLAFTDVSPVIIDGRTLLPFRSVFEQMGATVDYDEATRTATASFNGNEISFSIDGDKIYSEGEVVYTMDVPPTIQNGRTLVPVRAVAEAGGLEVGWDSEARTVNVIDEEALKNELEGSIAALDEFNSLFENRSDVYTLTETLDFSDDGIKLDLSGKTVSDGNARKFDAEFDIDYSSEDDDGVDFSASDVSLNAVVTDDALCFKTDLLDKIADSKSGNLYLRIISAVLPSDKYYEVKLGELEAMISGSSAGKLSSAVTDSADIFQTLIDAECAADATSLVESLNIDSTSEIKTLFADTVAETKNLLSKALTVSYNDDSTATVTFELDGGVKASATYANGVAVKANIEITDGENMTMKYSSTASTAGVIEKVVVPENTTNFVDKLDTIFNLKL